MPFVNKFKILVCTACLVLVGQGFGAEVCESDLWENCTSQPATQTISGTTYYSINSAEELAWFAAKVNTTEKGKPNVSSGINAILLKDIDLSGKMWTPIAAGKGDTKFSGILDGNNHKITGLTIDGLRLAYETENIYCSNLSPSKPYCNGQNIGLIGSLGGTVKNLNLEVADIQASNSEGLSFQMGKPISVGTLVGWMGSGTIDGVYVNGHINTSGNGQGVGGIVGNAQSGTVKNSVCDVAIYASGDDVFVGGILGYTKGAVNVNSCMYVGESIANDGANGSVGGIVGKSTVNSLNATNSYYDTDVVSNGVGTGSVNNNKKPTGVTDLNTEQVACGMNGGTWNANTQVCSNATTNEWEVGISELSQNGSDGYKITFVVNAEDAAFPDGAVATKLVAKNAAITADGISLPTREGYKFAGWAETDDAEDPSANLGTATGRRTIYAVWYGKFPVTFNAGTGSFPNGTPDPLMVAKGDLISLDIEVPVKSADGSQVYSFAGWSTSSEEIIFEVDDEITGLWDFDNDRVSEAMTLYAAWTKAEVYTVKFNANGHGRTEWDQVNVSKDEYLATPPVIADPGYQYDGWYTEPTFDNKFDAEKTQITKNYELFAKWSAIPYAINYNLDGGSVPNPDNPSTYTVEDQFVLKDPSKACYDFIGWYDLNGNHVEGITKGTTEEKTFSARWEQQTKVINYSTGNVIQATARSHEFLCGETITLSDTIDAFSRPGYTQDGWTTSIGGSNVLAPKSSYTGTANVALYAHWNLNSYDIIYNLDGGVFATPAISSYSTEDAVVLAVPTRDGYEFDGWYTNAEFNGDKVASIDAGSIGDTTFYAKWTKDTYEITYELNNGSMDADNPGSYTVEDAVTLPIPTRDDSKFMGWFANANFEGDAVTGFDAGATGNKTFYARWATLVETYGGVKIYQIDGSETLVADIDGSSMETIDIDHDIEVASVSYDRIFSKEKYATVVLPFSINLKNVHGGTFYNIIMEKNEEDLWVARRSDVSDRLEANKPYLVYPTAEKLTFDGSVTFNTSVNNDSRQDVDGGYWTFKAAYAYHKWEVGDEELGRAYGFAANAVAGYRVGQFVKIGKDSWIRPMRGYLLFTETSEQNPPEAPSPSLAKRNRLAYVASIEEELPETIDVLDIVVKTEKTVDSVIVASIDVPNEVDDNDVDDVAEEDETTAIGSLNTVPGEVKVMDRWYDMKGRRLNAKPTIKGIYYYKGKQVIVK